MQTALPGVWSTIEANAPKINPSNAELSREASVWIWCGMGRSAAIVAAVRDVTRVVIADP